jgi:thiol-disulfide isomerase/thioredoxin
MEKDLDKKIRFLESFKTDFPESNMINNMAYSIVRGYLDSGKIDALKSYMTENPDIRESYVYDRVATQLLTEDKELEFAAELIQKGIRLSEQQREDPAPEFSLEDLEGNQVSLASLKGKTFVLDFWATWCGPCIGSFPGMKRVVEKYRDDSAVEFLFVNTWQREENKKKIAQDFITKNGYPFHVLMDAEDKVVEAFEVRGIPTKFIVDKNGNIRFTKIGYGGKDEKMIKELDVMIAMVK